MSTFLYMGRWKSHCSLKSFLPYASQLSGASIMHLSSVLTIGSGCDLIAARLLSCLPWRAGITDDCDIVVCWYRRKSSISYIRGLKTNQRYFHGHWCLTCVLKDRRLIKETENSFEESLSKLIYVSLLYLCGRDKWGASREQPP